MFTKEKLERWIDVLDDHICIEENFLKQVEGRKALYEGIAKRKSYLEDLKHTLEQIYTSMTSDNSI